MASSMIDSSLRNKAFVYQIRKRFSLPSNLSNEDCFIIYSKELEYHNCILNKMIRCLKDLHNKNQVYEFGKYLKDIGYIHNYTYIYELMKKKESSFTRLKRPEVIQAYRNIINEYHKWIEQDVHNIKEARINSIRKRIDDYFKKRIKEMKALEYLKLTMKELQHAPAQYDREIAEIIECIAELEALQHRSCEGCKHLLASPRICLKRIQNCDGILPKDFCCNRYEPKENL